MENDAELLWGTRTDSKRAWLAIVAVCRRGDGAGWGWQAQQHRSEWPQDSAAHCPANAAGKGGWACGSHSAKQATGW